jgi:translation elongation factor EF-4
MELGIMHPEEIPTSALHPGQVGYMACNMKQSSEGIANSLLAPVRDAEEFYEAHIGDTFHHVGVPVEPMPGFKPTQPMVERLLSSCTLKTLTHRCQVFAGVFPIDSSDFPKLEEAIQKARMIPPAGPATDRLSS